MKTEEHGIPESHNHTMVTLAGENEVNHPDMYLKGLSVYAQNIKAYTFKIKKLKNKIDYCLKENEASERQLRAIENDILLDMRVLERLNSHLRVKIESSLLLKEELANMENTSAISVF